MKVTYLDQHLKHSEFNSKMNCDLPVQRERLQTTIYSIPSSGSEMQASNGSLSLQYIYSQGLLVNQEYPKLGNG